MPPNPIDSEVIIDRLARMETTLGHVQADLKALRGDLQVVIVRLDERDTGHSQRLRAEELVRAALEAKVENLEDGAKDFKAELLALKARSNTLDLAVSGVGLLALIIAYLKGG